MIIIIFLLPNIFLLHKTMNKTISSPKCSFSSTHDQLGASLSDA